MGLEKLRLFDVASDLELSIKIFEILLSFRNLARQVEIGQLFFFNLLCKLHALLVDLTILIFRFLKLLFERVLARDQLSRGGSNLHHFVRLTCSRFELFSLAISRCKFVTQLLQLQGVALLLGYILVLEAIEL